MRTITYKVSDEVEKLLAQEQQQGESLNQTARRLMMACLMQDGHTMEVNQSIPGIPQDSVVMSRLVGLERQVEEYHTLLNEYMDIGMMHSEEEVFERDHLVREFRSEYDERLEKLCDRVSVLEKNQPRPQPKKIEVGCKVLGSANATEKAIRSQSGEVVKSSGDGQWWVTINKGCYLVHESELVWLSAPPPPAPELKPESKPEPRKLQPGDKIKIANIVPDAYAVHRGLTGRLEAIASDKVTIKSAGKTITIPRKYIEFVPPEQKTTAKKSTGRRRKRSN